MVAGCDILYPNLDHLLKNINPTGERKTTPKVSVLQSQNLDSLNWESGAFSGKTTNLSSAGNDTTLDALFASEHP